MNTSLTELIQEAIGYEALAFETDDEIDGGDLTEWFADWRERAKTALKPLSVSARTPAESRRLQTQLIGVLQALQSLQRRRYQFFGEAENTRLIEALHNGGFQILVGELGITVFKRHEAAGQL